MNKLFAVSMLALLAVFPASAQVVAVQLSLNQEQFLPGESLPVTVRVINNSGQSLRLGADPGWLKFSVASLDTGAGVPKLSDPPVVEPFDLDTSQAATKHVDIAPYFKLGHAGRYRVVATMHIAEWGSDVTSTPVEFDVIDGAEIWSLDFGVPNPAGVTNQPPEVRKYILEEANYLRQQLRMYVLVSNQSKTHFYKVSAVGPMVSFSQPEAQLDRKSNLHLLYQSSAHAFVYTVVNPDGEITQQDVYDLLNTRPRLGLGSDGNITVVGGIRRMRPGELPVVQQPQALPVQAPTSAPTKK
jgi:hypothetical protein